MNSRDLSRNLQDPLEWIGKIGLVIYFDLRIHYIFRLAGNILIQWSSHFLPMGQEYNRAGSEGMLLEILINPLLIGAIKIFLEYFYIFPRNRSIGMFLLIFDKSKNIIYFLI